MRAKSKVYFTSSTIKCLGFFGGVFFLLLFGFCGVLFVVVFVCFFIFCLVFVVGFLGGSFFFFFWGGGFFFFSFLFCYYYFILFGIQMDLSLLTLLCLLYYISNSSFSHYG